MHRISPLALAAVLTLAHAAAHGGSKRGGAQTVDPATAPRSPATRGNREILRDLDRSVKSATTGTPLRRALRVRRTSGKAGGRAYLLKAEDATLVQKPRTGGRATIQLGQGRHSDAVKSSIIRVPSRTRRGGEMFLRNENGYLEISVRDPERGEVIAAVTPDPVDGSRATVSYFTLPPGDHMRTRPPVSPAEASAFFAGMGGFHPAKGTRAARAIADFARRVKATAAQMPPAERQRLTPLIEILTPSSTSAPSVAPAPAPRQRRARRAADEEPGWQRPPLPNATLFAEARRSLRLAAQDTPLSRQQRVAARPGERAYAVDARKATLSQDGVHGRSSLHIENNWGKDFRPRAARVSVPGTSARGARLEIDYTPHRMRIELRDERRGALRIALDSEVNTPGGIRYSILEIAGSSRAAEVSPAEALRFVRDVGGFQPAPGVRAAVAVRDLARRLEATARGMTAAERAELAPLIAALGGARQPL